MFAKRYLSENDREKLGMALLGLNTIQIFLAMSGFALGAYISLDVSAKAHFLKEYSLKPIGATLSGSSIPLFFLHCFGAKASNDCCYRRTRHRFEGKLFAIVLGRVDYTRSVPFSCCDPSHPGPCFHRQVNTVRGQHRHSDFGFFQKGCTEVLLSAIQEITLATAILVLVPVFVEVSIAVLTRFLQTSIKDSKKRGNSNDLGCCWLFKRPEYEPCAQPKVKVRVRNLDFSSDFYPSSSEDSVLSDEVYGTTLSEVSEATRSSNTYGKATLKNERHSRRMSDAPDDSSLKRLLLQQLDDGESSRSKRGSFFEAREKSHHGGKASRVTRKRKSEETTKFQRDGIGSETKPTKDKACGK